MLREVLFRLWGDLEEKKSAYLKKRGGEASKAAEKSLESNMATAKSKAMHTKPGDDLPPDSDDESIPKAKEIKNSSTNEIEGNASDVDKHNTDLSAVIASLPITNKGFTCCIQQYGIKVPEKLYSKADAGGGFRWKRMFGLFGTMIA